MNMTSPEKKARAIPIGWHERKNWEQLQHLAETALKMMEEASTRDLVPALINRADALVQHLKNLAQQVEENNTHE